MANRELLFRLTKKDFIVQTFCSGGKGGQNQNKVASGVRIIHPESGAVGESRNFRDQPQNKKAAFDRLIKSSKFQAWHKIKCAKMMGQAVDAETWVNDQMRPENLRIEEIIVGGTRCLVT